MIENVLFLVVSFCFIVVVVDSSWLCSVFVNCLFTLFPFFVWLGGVHFGKSVFHPTLSKRRVSVAGTRFVHYSSVLLYRFNFGFLNSRVIVIISLNG